MNDISFIFEFKKTVIFRVFEIKPIKEQIGKAINDSTFPSVIEKELLFDKLIFLIIMEQVRIIVFLLIIFLNYGR